MQTSIFVLNCSSLKQLLLIKINIQISTTCYITHITHYNREIKKTNCWLSNLKYIRWLLQKILFLIYIWRVMYYIKFIFGWSSIFYCRYNIIIIQFSCLKALKDIQENEYIKIVCGCIKVHFWQLHFFSSADIMHDNAKNNSSFISNISFMGYV